MKKTTLARDSALHMAAFCASSNLRRAARVVTRHYNQSLRKSGLTAAQLPILAAIASNADISIGHLAGMLDIERSAISRDVALLVRKGLVRANAAADRRVQRLHVTARGDRTLVHAFEAWKVAHAQLLSVIEERDLTSALAHMRRIGKAAKSLTSARKQVAR